MDAMWMREVAYGVTRALQDTTLVGTPASRTAAVRDRMDALLPGDWVVEVTVAIYRKSLNGFGRLVAKRREPVPGDWSEEDGQPMETVWYIETPEGALARWVNATFVSLPVDSAPDEQWAREAARRHQL